MQEPGEPMECWIFDFYKVFSRAFGEEEDGQGEFEWKVGDEIITDQLDWKSGASI